MPMVSSLNEKGEQIAPSSIAFRLDEISFAPQIGQVNIDWKWRTQANFAETNDRD
jgi:hypothetical protein